MQTYISTFLFYMCSQLSSILLASKVRTPKPIKTLKERKTTANSYRKLIALVAINAKILSERLTM